MFARTFAIASLAVLAVAAADDCKTGPVQCCNTVTNASDANNILKLTGVNVLADLTGLVGINCSPVTVIGGAEGGDCKQQPVCCTGNRFNGLINVGCSTVSA